MGAKLRQEELHLQELGIATLSSIFVNANRDPKKGEPAKPSDFFYFKPIEDSKKISAIAADTFFSLVAEERMPSWAVSLAPVEKLRQYRANVTPPSTKAWVKRGVMLIAPQLNGTKVKVPLALVDGVSGAISLIDIDAGVAYKVLIENPKNESYWASDVEFDILGGLYG